MGRLLPWRSCFVAAGAYCALSSSPRSCNWAIASRVTAQTCRLATRSAPTALLRIVGSHSPAPSPQARCSQLLLAGVRTWPPQSDVRASQITALIPCPSGTGHHIIDLLCRDESFAWRLHHWTISICLLLAHVAGRGLFVCRGSSCCSRVISRHAAAASSATITPDIRRRPFLACYSV